MQVQVDVAALMRGQAPDHVSLAAVALGRVELRVYPLHATEVEADRQSFRHELADKLLDHDRVTEQPVVDCVSVYLGGLFVFACGHSFSLGSDLSE